MGGEGDLLRLGIIVAGEELEDLRRKPKCIRLTVGKSRVLLAGLQCCIWCR